MGATSTLTTSVTCHSMPGLLSIPTSCAVPLNKTLSNKCIFFQPSSGFCEPQLDPKEKVPKPQTSENTKVLKPNLLPAGRGDSSGPSTPFIPHRGCNSCTSRSSSAQCSFSQVITLLCPFLGQLLPKSVRVKAQHPQIHVCQLAALLQDLSSDFLGSTAQQSANFPASLVKLFISEVGLSVKWVFCQEALLVVWKCGSEHQQSCVLLTDPLL